ncbi:MAG TPA: FHA domain-containing protein [Streptosporangiaceae bacterium]|nr:FHA domain-containing protein [Streptosporangiaceae bacterium]
MTAEREAAPVVAPALLVRIGGSDRSLDPGSRYRIGRDPAADLVVNEQTVSWFHAVLRADNGRWVLEDAGSTNGTYAGQQRVDRVDIVATCQVRLGHPDNGPVVTCSPAATPAGPGATELAPGIQRPARQPSGALPLARVLRIGRAPDNQFVVPDLGVSRYHAELRKIANGGYEIADLGSHNGTYVNGQRVSTAPVSEADVIGIGHATFRRVGGELQEFIDTGDVSLEARGLTVKLSSGKVILDDVTFPLGERCLLGVIGPSGAGKSTLLGALTGMRPATEGSVLYDERDLYRDYAELRHRIGLVPQENILHTQLSARRALGYAAELRFPRDVSKDERDRRITEVLEELSLTQHADTKTSSLSGGQQKRVNVALELLTKPSLLFLDEPTSGLDPGLDMSVMEMMAELASDGRTVIVVTHSVANLDICDRLLVLVPGGKVAYFGPPADGLKHFGQPGWAQVFRAFEAQPDRDWQAEYKRSAYHAQYVTAATQAPRPAAAARQAVPPPRSRNRLAQLSTLARRYFAVIAADRNYAVVLTLLPFILGALIRAVPDPKGLTGPANVDAQPVLLILVMSACLVGVANAVRELVKERAIYTRERAAGLSPGAYLWSKLVILGLISALQAVVMVYIGMVGRTLPPSGAFLTSQPLLEIIAAMALLAVASMVLGLLISAVVTSSDKTMPLLVLAVLVEVVVSGGVFAINGITGLEQLSWLAPSRWGFAAIASTADLNHIQPLSPDTKPDPLWDHTPHDWLVAMAMQAVLTLALIFLTWRRLARTRPSRER